jgi:hypothetical protein
MIQHNPASRSRFALRGLSVLAPDRLAAGLGRSLDDSYHYLRRAPAINLEPVDAIVVGPGGTWAITLVDEHGRFRKHNGHWYRWSGSTDSWVPWNAQAVTSARLAGHRLELFLERAGLPATVEACVVTDQGTNITWERDQRPGLHVHPDVIKLARRIARDDVLTPVQVDRIVAVLDPRQPLPRLAPSTPNG